MPAGEKNNGSPIDGAGRYHPAAPRSYRTIYIRYATLKNMLVSSCDEFSSRLVIAYERLQERNAIIMKERGQKKSNIFKILRLCMGLSLNDMAEKCGVSAVYLNELERGKKLKPSDHILSKIASACGIKIDTLRFFLEDCQGEALDYQKYLLQSLEHYAQTKQQK